MRQRKIFTLITFIFASSLSSNPCLAIDATLLIQESPITGTQRVYIGRKAFRIDNAKTGTTIVCKAPDWNVDLFNKATRKGFHTTASKFNAAFLQVRHKDSEGIMQLKWKKQAPDMVAGIAATKYSALIDKTLAEGLSPIVKSNYWVASDLGVNGKACEVLSKVDNVPSMGSIPLDLAYASRNLESEHAYYLKTTSWKKVSLVDPFFEIPKFKMVAHERDILNENAESE